MTKNEEGTNAVPENLAIYDRIQYELSIQSAQMGKRSQEIIKKQNRLLRGVAFGTGVERNLGFYRLQQETEEEEEKYIPKITK